MNARLTRYALALALLAPALAALAADKDGLGDPLPDGAKVRIGTARLRVQPYSSPLLTPDGKTLYAQTNAGVGRLDPATGAAQGKAPAQFFGVPTAVSDNGKRALFVSFDRVTVWDADTGKTVAKVERRLPSSENAAALSADGKTLALGGLGDRTKQENAGVLLWDVAADKELKKIAVPLNEYVAVALSGDGKLLATWGGHYDPDAKAPDPEANPSRFVTFWSAAEGKQLAKFRVPGYAPGAVAFSPDGSVAAVANGTTSSIDLVDPKTGAAKQLLLGRSQVGRWLAFSPDGATVAATSDGGTVQRWKVADGTPLSTTEPPVPGLMRTRVRVTGTDRGVAWAVKGSAVVTWEVPSGKLLSPEGGNTSSVRTVAVTPDNKFVVTSADDGATLKWELATGKPAGAVALRSPYGGGPPTALFSPGLRRALVRTNGGFGLYDAAAGTEQYVIPAPLDGYSTTAFSADGAKVLVATTSYNVKQSPARVAVWDVATTRRLLSLDLPGVGTVAAALSPDGKRLVTAGRKQTDKGNGEFLATVWELPAAKPEGPAAGGEKKGEYTEEAGFSLPAVAAAPDNKSAAVFTSKGVLAALDLATGKLGKTLDIGRRAPVVTPVFSADGKMLAVACQSDFITGQAPVLVFDWESGKEKHAFTASGTPTCLAFSPDGKWLVTGSSDTTATVWELGAQGK